VLQTVIVSEWKILLPAESSATTLTAYAPSGSLRVSSDFGVSLNSKRPGSVREPSGWRRKGPLPGSERGLSHRQTGTIPSPP